MLGTVGAEQKWGPDWVGRLEQEEQGLEKPAGWGGAVPAV